MSASSSCDCCQNLSQLGVPICNVSDSASLLEAQEETAEELAVKLPGVISISDYCDCKEYPIVKRTKQKIMFQKMSQILDNLYDYEENILGFWILDVFIEGLKSSQEAGMDFRFQKTTLLWIAFMFNYMQLNDIPRKDMFKYLFDLILPIPQKTNPGFEYFGEGEVEEAEKIIHFIAPEGSDNKFNTEIVWEIPLPPKLGTTVNKESTELSAPSFDIDYKNSKSFTDGNISTETNLKFMKVILEIIYRIFDRFWVFKALQMIFHQTPKAKIVDLPFKLYIPKPILPLEPLLSVKSGRSQKKQTEEEDMIPAVLKNDFILPLQLADGAKPFVRELFNIRSKEVIPLTKKTKK